MNPSDDAKEVWGLLVARHVEIEAKLRALEHYITQLTPNPEKAKQQLATLTNEAREQLLAGTSDDDPGFATWLKKHFERRNQLPPPATGED